ncbi:MAG: pantoate--beta-alanine ligase [Candidatus Omnitrophica bacterium]|nr:pantoate--beta-alanine ligase [Candidatus Omnitrophota bacterium]
MRIFKEIKEAQGYIKKEKEKGRSVGFVPTMGYLHEGHLSLIREARKRNDLVVVSIFVNPAQFGPKEDYKRYPRDLKRDERLARASGADIIFYPSVRGIYPDGYQTYVEVTDITERLCGKSRPGHFKGVATIVTKLFNIVQPDIAYFGQKDAQQAIVIKRMAGDLNMDLKIRVMPIVREPDGLAMSSRNRYLSDRERSDAPVLYDSLNLARRLIKSGCRDTNRIKNDMKRLIKSKKGARIDYISISDLRNLRELKRIKKEALIALAVRIGKRRLIDNMIVGGRI